MFFVHGETKSQREREKKEKKHARPHCLFPKPKLSPAHALFLPKILDCLFDLHVLASH